MSHPTVHGASWCIMSQHVSPWCHVSDTLVEDRALRQRKQASEDQRDWTSCFRSKSLSLEPNLFQTCSKYQEMIECSCECSCSSQSSQSSQSCVESSGLWTLLNILTSFEHSHAISNVSNDPLGFGWFCLWVAGKHFPFTRRLGSERARREAHRTRAASSIEGLQLLKVFNH